jgi:two-component system OmpR family sensor kinase
VLRVSGEVARPPVTITFFDAAGAPLAGTGRTPANNLAVRALGTSAFALGLRPVRVSLAGGAGSAVIAPDAGSVATRMRAYSLAMLPPGVAAILLAILLGRQVAKGAVRPMLDVTRSLDALAAGEFTPRSVAAASTTEVRALAEAYDRAVRHVAAAFAERRETEMHIRQFIADAGHQLRTPLTIIMGYVDLLDGGIVREPEMRARVYENMRAEGKRMRGLVDKLIFLARLDRPESDDPPEAIDVASLATQIVAALRALPEISGRLDVEVPALSPLAPPLLVQADATELREAIENLLDNAFKYAGGTVLLRVSADETSVAVSVADHGPGIDITERDRIFDRFYRGGANDAEIEGSGLGLAIVKRAVERAHGAIEIAGNEPTGIRFTIRLQRVRNAAF